MRVAVSDAREREEKALEEAKKAKFEAQAYIRRCVMMMDQMRARAHGKARE